MSKKHGYGCLELIFLCIACWILWGKVTFLEGFFVVVLLQLTAD